MKATSIYVDKNYLTCGEIEQIWAQSAEQQANDAAAQRNVEAFPIHVTRLFKWLVPRVKTHEASLADIERRIAALESAHLVERD